MESISPVTLGQRTIEFGGTDRRFWLATPTLAPAPLVIVLHGTGMSATVMARWTGLAERGPQGGLAVAFPDAIGEVWDDSGGGRRDALADPGFINRVVDVLVEEGVARRQDVFLAGLLSLSTGSRVGDMAGPVARSSCGLPHRQSPPPFRRHPRHPRLHQADNGSPSPSWGGSGRGLGEDVA